MSRLVLDGNTPTPPPLTGPALIAALAQTTPTVQQHLGKNVGGVAKTAQTAAPVAGGVSGGGGGGGGGAGVASSLPSFDLNNEFGYQQELKNEQDALNDYDAQSLYGQQTTQSDQAVKRAALTDQLNKLGQNNAEDFASRGLGSSGLVFKAQDDIDKQGVTANNGIDQLLSQFLGTRQQGRQSLQQQQAAQLAQVAQQLTSQYAGSALASV